MVAIRAQVILKTADNVSENFITNSLAFEADALLGQTADITTLIKDFYDDVLTYLSPSIAQLNHEVKYYALPGVTPNYPYDIDTFNLAAAPAGSACPSEVAVAVSFQGTKQAGFPQNRRRGRIYVGPFDQTALDGVGRPAAGLITALSTAAATFGSQLQALTPAVVWGVWSQTDGQLVPIDNGWIDNSFDTVRRRGVDPTSRTTFIV